MLWLDVDYNCQTRVATESRLILINSTTKIVEHPISRTQMYFICLQIAHYYISLWGVVRYVSMSYLLTHCFTGETEHMYVDSTPIKCYD